MSHRSISARAESLYIVKTRGNTVCTLHARVGLSSSSLSVDLVCQHLPDGDCPRSRRKSCSCSAMTVYHSCERECQCSCCHQHYPIPWTLSMLLLSPALSDPMGSARGGARGVRALVLRFSDSYNALLPPTMCGNPSLCKIQTSFPETDTPVSDSGPHFLVEAVPKTISEKKMLKNGQFRVQKDFSSFSASKMLIFGTRILFVMKNISLSYTRWTEMENFGENLVCKLRVILAACFCLPRSRDSYAFGPAHYF